MKIAVWRYDSTTKSFIFESDFREGQSNFIPGSDQTFIDTLTVVAPADVERVNQGFNDLFEGRSDFYHEEYQVTNPYTGETYWEESYATIVERDVDGKPSKIVGTSQRIDERKGLEASLVFAFLWPVRCWIY